MNIKKQIPTKALFCLLATVFWLFCSSDGTAKKTSRVYINTDLVSTFYKQNFTETFWHQKAAPFSEFRKYFLLALDSCLYTGLDKNRYHYTELKNALDSKDTIEIKQQDNIFTDAVIAFYKDMYLGRDIRNYIRSDEISAKYMKEDNGNLLRKISRVNNIADFNSMLTELEPKQKDYISLKRELKKQLTAGNTTRITELQTSLNLYRWIHHFHFRKAIIVNIPAAELQYFEHDSLLLHMKVVVGKPSTRSPRFTTWCYQVILYPYWNVPASIGKKEILPIIKRSPQRLQSMNLQVIGRNGSVVDAQSIDWTRYNRTNFPYSFRQCTGCDNALGVIKFNLTDPFNVYLHDTNYKLAFLSASRFLSHGCIRVEKPIELGNYILDQQLDSAFLKACFRNRKPVILNVANQVPVFVVYMIAEVKNDTVIFHKDIYHLF